MDQFEVDDLIDKEYRQDEEIVTNHEINRIITNLQLFLII